MQKYLFALLAFLLVTGTAFASPATATLVQANGSDMLFELGATSATTTEKMRITTTGLVSASAFKGDASQLTGIVTPTTPVYFSADKNGGTQTLSGRTESKLTFTNEISDTHSYYSTASSRFTPKVAGKYFFTLTISCWGLSGPGTCGAALMKNGSWYRYNGGWVGYMVSNVSDFIDMNGTTDYVEAYGYTDNSYGNVRFGSDSTTNFSGVLVR